MHRYRGSASVSLYIIESVDFSCIKHVARVTGFVLNFV